MTFKRKKNSVRPTLHIFSPPLIPHLLVIIILFLTDALQNGSNTLPSLLKARAIYYQTFLHLLLRAMYYLTILILLDTFWSFLMSTQRKCIWGRAWVKLPGWQPGLSSLPLHISNTSRHSSSISWHLNTVPSKLVPGQSLHFLCMPPLSFAFF